MYSGIFKNLNRNHLGFDLFHSLETLRKEGIESTFYSHLLLELEQAAINFTYSSKSRD